MLNALAAALQQSGTDARVLKKVEEAKRERRFEKKAKLAADVLPQHL
jgi:hypothetical protein